MSGNSYMFPDRALYIHPSIIFVEFDFTFTEHIYNILPYRFALGLLFGNLYLFLLKYRILLFMDLFRQYVTANLYPKIIKLSISWSL